MLSLDELLEKVEEDSIVDNRAIEQEIVRSMTLFSRWMRYHAEYKDAIIKGETILNQHIVDAQLFYSGEAEPIKYRGHPHCQIRAKNSSEMSRLIDGDFDANEYREKVDSAIQCKEICERMLDNLKYRPNHLKTILEKRKFEAGD